MQFKAFSFANRILNYKFTTVKLDVGKRKYIRMYLTKNRVSRYSKTNAKLKFLVDRMTTLWFGSYFLYG
jgi:hypothetical protein